MRTGIVFVGLAALTLAMCLPAHAQQVKLTNSGFEEPDIMEGASLGSTPEGWFVFSSTETAQPGVTDARKRTGSQSLRFKAQQEADAFQGLAQEFLLTPGRHYSFIVHVMCDPADPLVGESFGQISFEWKEDTGKELGRTYGPTWNFELSSSRWEKLIVDGEPPEGTAKANVVITFFGKDSKGLGTFYVDDCELHERTVE